MTRKIFDLLPLPVSHASFRLLELHFKSDAIGTDEPMIHATMRTYDSRHKPEYDALSYTWGTQVMSSNIRLNGHLFPVTPNLLAALEQLLLDQCNDEAGNKKFYWIDAICINQGDNLEKSRHVLRMREIYANAQNVHMWIGKSSPLSSMAFDTLKRFAAPDGTQDGSMTFRDILDTVRERKNAIQNLLERPYFVRVWIIQEVVVANNATVMCGSFSISYDDLYIAVQRMTASQFYPFSSATSNVSYLGEWRATFLAVDAPDREENLGLRLFMDSRDRSATDLRDKIYSLRGIANDALAAGIIVDYDNSIERVYTDHAKHLLKVRHDLTILSAVILRHRKTSTLLLPSWVPDWSQPKYGGGILNRYYRFKPTCLFRASGESRSRVALTEQSDAISVEGKRLDTVKFAFQIKSLLSANGGNHFSTTETNLREIVGQLLLSATYSFTDEPSWKAFFRTLTADRTALSPRINDGYRSKFFAALSDVNLNHENWGENLPAVVWAEISKNIGPIIEDKDMFLTSQGYLGLGQEGFRSGDIVCILLGGEVPYLLRQTVSSHTGIFNLLSECYIHGIMDGEAMKDQASDNLETFIIH